MMEGNTFVGLDAMNWNDIFSLLNVLIQGASMAFFGKYYQLRKKTEVVVKVEVTRLRLTAYEDIAKVCSRLWEQVSPTLADDTVIKKLLGTHDITDVNTDYSSCLGSEREFDSFYGDLCEVSNSNDIFLDYEVRRQCTNAISFFTHLKIFLDAYRDTEHLLNEGRMDTHSLQERIDFTYRLAAVLMKNEINKASLQLCDVIADKIDRIRITYRKWYIRKMAYYLFEPVFRLADKHLGDDSWRGRLSRMFIFNALNDRIASVVKIQILVDMLADRMESPSDFLMTYYAQLHHNR